MKKLLSSCLVVFLISSNGFAFDWKRNWSVQDSILQGSFILIASVDWLQTRYIATHPHFKESNPILGKETSLTKINSYFSICIIGQTLISYILPNPYRVIWQSFWIGFETNTIAYNYNAGIKLKF